MRLASNTPDPTPNPENSVPAPAKATTAISTGAAAYRACPGCHEVWPIHMLEEFGDSFLCKPCKHDAEAVAKAPKRPSYMGHMSADKIRNWGIVFTLFAVAIYMGSRMGLISMLSKGRGDGIEKTQPWAKKPAAKWPTLTMSAIPGNGAKTPNEWQLGPNACLIQRKDGSIVCASAVAERTSLALAVQAAEGKAPPAPVTYQQFAKIVPNCRLAVGKENVTFSALLPDAHGAFDQGLVFFTKPGKLPKDWQPLQMREGVYMGGMKMVVLARNPKTGAQEPLDAMVASNNLSSDVAAVATDQLHDVGRKVGDGSESLITLAHPYSAEALIGAPVVDVRGNLAAIITMAYSPTDTEGLTTDFVAYGMHALKAFTAPAPAAK